MRARGLGERAPEQRRRWCHIRIDKSQTFYWRYVIANFIQDQGGLSEFELFEEQCDGDCVSGVSLRGEMSFKLPLSRPFIV